MEGRLFTLSSDKAFSDPPTPDNTNKMDAFQSCQYDKYTKEEIAEALETFHYIINLKFVYLPIIDALKPASLIASTSWLGRTMSG